MEHHRQGQGAAVSHLQVDLLLVVTAALHDSFELGCQLEHLSLGPTLKLKRCSSTTEGGGAQVA